MMSYTQPNFYVKYINRAILANLQCKTLKLGRLIVLQEAHLQCMTLENSPKKACALIG